MNIDWSLFDTYPESTCSCRCGATFRSHSKFVWFTDEESGIMTRKPCPSCGHNDTICKSESDPEGWTIG